MENDSCADQQGSDEKSAETVPCSSDAAAAGVPTGSLIDHPSFLDTSTAPSTPNPAPSSDGSWEEKYNKLKSLTLRYKKKIADQNSELETLRTKQNASKIQFEYDKALDEIE